MMVVVVEQKRLQLRPPGQPGSAGNEEEEEGCRTAWERRSDSENEAAEKA